MIFPQWNFPEPETMQEKVLLSVTPGEPPTKSPAIRLGFFMRGPFDRLTLNDLIL